ncbi:hypothetical protein Esti_000260 [Eimeria stiedai]
MGAQPTTTKTLAARAAAAALQSLVLAAAPGSACGNLSPRTRFRVSHCGTSPQQQLQQQQGSQRQEQQQQQQFTMKGCLFRVAALLRRSCFVFPKPQQAQVQLGRRTACSSSNSSSSINSSSSSSSARTGIGAGTGCCMLGSPLAFTDWQQQSPKSELFFLSGKALGNLTERIFENEAGQSLFMLVLFVVYLSLLGFEGKVNGAVFRLKHAVAANWHLPVHRNYMHALPPNPLLQQHKSTAAADAKKYTS